MISAWLQEAQEWVKGLLGDRLSAAYSEVRAAKQRGTVGAEVHPQVQGFVQTLDQLRLATNAYLAKAVPLSADNPDLQERIQRMVFAYNTLVQNWQDPANTRPNAAAERRLPVQGELVGAPPLLFATLLTVGIGSASWAVSELGAAWALAAKGDAEVALAQVQLQQQDLDARVAASEDGRTLPPATVNQPNPAPTTASEVSDLVKVAAAGVGVLGLVGGLAWLAGNRGR